LQYVLGFRRLGWDAVFVDRLEPEMVRDEAGRPCPLARSVNVSYFREVVRRFGLEGHAALLCDGGTTSFGLSKAELVERTRRSALLLNVMGYLTEYDVLSAAPLRVFLDIDPGFCQMWSALGLADLFAGHERHVTIAENLGSPSCAIPECGLEWETTRQPVVLEHWPAVPDPGTHFTTVAAWRGPYAPIEYEGRRFGLRVHEWRKFARLPALARVELEIALEIDPADERDRELLARAGWRLVDPKVVARDPDAYRHYIGGSLAEFSAAKSMYVEAHSGWFSDRSICYLASGRPVVTQDTGFSEFLPVGEGLLAFSTLEEARAALQEVHGSWRRHSEVARALAEEYFDSDLVLRRLLGRLGVA
jgi:hypothetical protein